MTQGARPDVLVADGLEVSFRVRGHDVKVLHGVSLRIGAGESYGLVGESGCGKSTVAAAAVRYLAGNGRVSGGRIEIAGRDLMALGSEDLRRLRATTVATVSQDPSRALNPSLRVSVQIAEIFRRAGQDVRAALESTVDMLRRVQIADPGRVMDRYPHQLSGGMQQRVAIAMALATNPALLILDEPTTGLDATVEAEVLALIRELRERFGTALLFISHNLAVVARMCERVGVLYAGRLIEEGAPDEMFRAPRHPYTAGLLRCLPRAGQRKDGARLATIPGFLPAPGDARAGCGFAERCTLADTRCGVEVPTPRAAGSGFSACHYPERVAGQPASAPPQAGAAHTVDRAGPPLLLANGVGKSYGHGHHAVRALTDVSLALWPGETLSLVGESGSGKTTLARVLLGLTAPDPGGTIQVDGKALPALAGRRSRAQTKSIQIVFQNPDSALNRAHSVRRIIGRALGRLGGVAAAARSERLARLAHAVLLSERHIAARPRQLSGGLKQRVAIARAFAGDPRIIVCDEPTSALDVSVQASILNLLADLQAERGVSYLFISHDLSVVRYLADRIAVLYLGRLMEIGLAEDVLAPPHHPYTEALVAAFPMLDDARGERVRLTGEIPSPSEPPSGCVFHTRCPRKLGPICEQQEPPLRPVGAYRELRCHLDLGALRAVQAA